MLFVAVVIVVQEICIVEVEVTATVFDETRFMPSADTTSPTTYPPFEELNVITPSLIVPLIPYVSNASNNSYTVISEFTITLFIELLPFLTRIWLSIIPTVPLL